MAGGYAKVTNYLQNYDIPVELNPSGACQRAPETTSTREAIIFSFGLVEQEIFTAIDEERPGFMGGWISSMALVKLMKDKGLRKAPNRRPDMLYEMGYVPHPGLRDGRTTTKNLIDGGKTRLFVKKGHLINELRSNDIITAAYIRAQGLTDAVDTKKTEQVIG